MPGEHHPGGSDDPNPILHHRPAEHPAWPSAEDLGALDSNNHEKQEKRNFSAEAHEQSEKAIEDLATELISYGQPPTGFLHHYNRKEFVQDKTDDAGNVIPGDATWLKHTEQAALEHVKDIPVRDRDGFEKFILASDSQNEEATFTMPDGTQQKYRDLVPTLLKGLESGQLPEEFDDRHNLERVMSVLTLRAMKHNSDQPFSRRAAKPLVQIATLHAEVSKHLPDFNASEAGLEHLDARVHDLSGIIRAEQRQPTAGIPGILIKGEPDMEVPAEEIKAARQQLDRIRAQKLEQEAAAQAPEQMGTPEAVANSEQKQQVSPDFKGVYIPESITDLQIAEKLGNVRDETEAHIVGVLVELQNEKRKNLRVGWTSVIMARSGEDYQRYKAHITPIEDDLINPTKYRGSYNVAEKYALANSHRRDLNKMLPADSKIVTPSGREYSYEDATTALAESLEAGCLPEGFDSTEGLEFEPGQPTNRSMLERTVDMMVDQAILEIGDDPHNERQSLDRIQSLSTIMEEASKRIATFDPDLAGFAKLNDCIVSLNALARLEKKTSLGEDLSAVTGVLEAARQAVDRTQAIYKIRGWRTSAEQYMINHGLHPSHFKNMR